MSGTPKLFISFSTADQQSVRKLFAALEIQNISVWDYSDEGRELPLAHELRASLKKRIDLCAYFLAVISPNSINENISRTSRFEVSYAIESGKAKDNTILPVLLHNPSDEWLSLFPELEPVLRITLDDETDERFEETIRRTCQWLSVAYTPSALKDPRVFFTKLFLEEVQSQRLKNADFVKLLRVMNSCASKVLKEDWKAAREKTTLFLSLAEETAPEASFQYPWVIKGICELQLKEFEAAEQTFLKATTIGDVSINPLLWLGFAGLGHTYASLNRFDKSLEAFQKAVELEPDPESVLDPAVNTRDKYLQFNYLAAILSSGGAILDEEILDIFDLSTLSQEEQLTVITLKGALNYKKGDYARAIRAFGDLEVNDLDEASAIYYSLALQQRGEDQRAIEVLSYVANRLNSINLYHHLASSYLNCSDLNSARTIYEEFLCDITTPSDYARQILVEYAQIIRKVWGDQSPEFRNACERAVNFEVLPHPQSKSDCFFAGFAYYLLGKNDLARHYYVISTGFSTLYYDQLELEIL